MDFKYNSKIHNVFNLFVIVPILLLIGYNRFPEEYKKYLIYFAIILGVIYSYRLYRLMNWNKIVKDIGIVENMAQTDNVIGCRNVHHVKVFDSLPGFSHPVLTVKSGDCVIWTNIGEVQHEISSTETLGGYHPDGLFKSNYLRPGESYGVKFVTPGKYPYYCEPHKGWHRGIILVE